MCAGCASSHEVGSGPPGPPRAGAPRSARRERRAETGPVSGKALRWLALLLACACGGPSWEPVTRTPGRTELVFLGTLHRTHLHDEDYPMRLLDRLLRAAEPEVIVAEIPPARLERVRRAVAEEADDPWLDSFPELSSVVLPVAEELGVPLVAGSGWTRQVTDDWQAYWAAHPDGPEGDLWERAHARITARMAEEGADPEWIHSPLYRELTAWHATALSTHAGRELGAADPLLHYRAHAARLREVIEAHRGERIVVVFDARVRWYFERELRQMGDVVVHDTRALLSALEDGGT